MADDITESIENQKKLLEANEQLKIKNIEIMNEKKRFESFVHALNESAIVAMTDLKGNILFANEKFCEISGYSQNELLGQNHRIIRSGYHDLAFFKNMWKTIVSGQIWKGEICNKRKNGDLYWVQSTIVPMYNEKGRIHRYISIRFDITEIKKLEQTLIESREIEKKSSNAKSDFLSNISHEIRTPLNGIIGVADILSGSNLNSEQNEWVNTILTSGKLLLELINDVLDYSKIEAGKMDIELLEVDVIHFLKDITAAHAFKAKSKHIGFNLSVPEIKHHILTDFGKLAQVINNLLSNAMKFTSKGRVCLVVIIEKETHDMIELSFEIRDSGIGMSQDTVQRLFQAFIQADASISRKYGGTGLGLSIVKKIVEMLHGHIFVESKEEKGSTFTVTIPFQKGSLLEDKKYSKTVESTQAPQTSLSGYVLVVEDNQVNMNIITKMLKDMNCRIDMAMDGKEAIEKAKQKTYDIILMDCRMPYMNGFEATEAIRVFNPQVPIIALTANASIQDKEACLASGMNDFLSKPITRDQVFQTLQKYLNKKSSESLLEIDYTMIEEIKAVSVDEPGFFEEQFQLFMTSSQDLIQRVDLALEDQNAHTMSELAHTLKGSCGSFGALGLSKICGQIELISSKHGLLPEIKELILVLKKELPLFYEVLRKEALKS